MRENGCVSDWEKEGERREREERKREYLIKERSEDKISIRVKKYNLI